MKVEIPQIYWHGDRNRIMSLDFYPNSNLLVTCGSDNEDKQFIKFWEVITNSSSNTANNNISLSNPNEESLSSLEIEKIKQATITNKDTPSTTIYNFLYSISGAHTSIVNVVRFSPNGKLLACGGDDNTLFIWNLKKRPVEFGSHEEKITWGMHKLLRGHTGDIYDLSWSRDSKYLISCSIDNTAIIFHIGSSKPIMMLKDHTHFVQGVSWDPLGEFVVTQSLDMSFCSYSINYNSNDETDVKCKLIKKLKSYIYENVKERKESKDESVNIENKENKMIVEEVNQISKIVVNKITNNFFTGETYNSGFFRRLSWSIDGSFCLAVTGLNYNSDDKKQECVVWGFTRGDLSIPTFMIPTLTPATCVRFCPIYFKKEINSNENNTNTELIDLPYKLVFAIGTQDVVLIFDTQSIHPKYLISNVHILQINDMTWQGSSMLSVGSSDGYISFIYFDEISLGEYEEERNLPDYVKDYYSQYRKIDYKKLASEAESGFNKVTQVKAIKKKKENQTNTNNAVISRNDIENNMIENEAKSEIENKEKDESKLINTLYQNKQSPNLNNNKDIELKENPNENEINNKRKRITPTIL